MQKDLYFCQIHTSGPERNLCGIFCSQTRYHQDISDSVSISISIPTSNLTNVMAGILAKEMRLPFHKLIVACSENDSFIDFVKTGVYKTDLLYDKV